MTKTANAIDISEFQDPSTFDYQAVKNAGIDTLIIRGSVYHRQDKFAKQHVANAQKYGFKWHLYHYFYGGTDEYQVAINNAKELGLTSGQYLFLDMENKSMPSDWNGVFAQFRQAVGDTFKVGLYCSDSPYKAKFNDSQLQSLGVMRWIASYSYEPTNYDIWQMSGAGGGGFGSYQRDVDRDYVANVELNAYANNDKPFVPPDVPQTVKSIILKPMLVNGIYGLGCSPDNGITNRIYWTIYGRKFYQEDADRLWPFLKNKITNAMSVDWDSIQNKPKFVTPDELEARLDKLSIQKMPDLSGYAKTSQIPTDVVTHAELAKATPKIDDSDKTTIKKPSDYADGIFYEVKSISALSINRSRFDSSAQTGSYGLVTTKVVTVNGTKFAHQKCEVLDSQRLIIFLRHGYSDNWTTWELNQTWS